MKENWVASEEDRIILTKIRKSIHEFIEYCANNYDKEGTMLDVAPEIYEGARKYFKKIKVETLDIDPKYNCTYTADICRNNHEIIKDNYFDYVLCTEVLEHTRDPFGVAKEIERILKPGGLAFITTPFNFRIHGPFPDYWRFTEFGLKELFRNFNIILLEENETKNRDLMPIQYRLIVEKVKKD